MTRRTIAILGATAALLAGCATTPNHERATHSPKGMVAAAHPLAADAGVEILEQGGNALDAAVATAFALNVVEPNASGMGGGGFLLYYDAKDRSVSVLDFREIAPASLEPRHASVDGKLNSSTMRYGGMAVAAPGMARGLLKAQAEHGELPRQAILAPAIRHAEDGFAVSEGLVGIMESKVDLLLEDGAASAIFLEDGLFTPAPGDVLVQKDLAATLRNVAEQGDAAVYGPEPAERIAAAVRARGGVLEASDIVNYAPAERPPVSGSYRGYDIVTIGAPSSGGLTMLLTLSVLDRYDVGSMSFDDPAFLALYIRAFAAAQEASDLVVADPAFTDVPVDELLSDEWVDRTVAAIQNDIGGRLALAANEAGGHEIAHVETDHAAYPGNTTHLSVIDSEGNMAALTQTINYWFGSCVAIPGMGIVMNNEMSDFSFEEGSVNVPEAGKRPRSSISPLLVLKNGHPIAALGTPGGRRIPSAISQIVVRCIDFESPLQDSVDAPRLHIDAADRKVSFESRIAEETMQQVADILGDGWSFESRGAFDAYFGGAQGIWIESGADGAARLAGAADPRRDGSVATTRE